MAFIGGLFVGAVVMGVVAIALVMIAGHGLYDDDDDLEDR